MDVLFFAGGCYLESLLNHWQRSGEDRLRPLLLHAWRLAGLVWTVLWSPAVVNNHGFVPLILEGVPEWRLPRGRVEDAEGQDFLDLSTAFSFSKRCYVAACLGSLPEVAYVRSWVSLREVGECIGFSPKSRTARRVAELVNAMSSRGLLHRGDILRLCFECERRP